MNMEFDKLQSEPVTNSAVLYQQVLDQSDICDVTIQVGEWKKQFHWCVLVISPFFKSVRKNSFMEKQTGIIKLNVASPLSTENAILYLYGRKPKLTDDNILAILDMSEFLMIPNLKSFCVKHIETMPIMADNCMKFLAMSSLYEFDLPMCYEYIRGHMDDVLQSNDTMHLTKESVIELFTDPHLSYVSSEVRFSYLLKWSARWGKNEAEFKEVLDCIDLDAMNKAFFEEKVLQHPLVPKEYKRTLLDTSSEEHRVLIFSHSLQENRMSCLDIDNEKWFGIEILTPDYLTPDDQIIHFSDPIRCNCNLTVPVIYRVAIQYSYFGVSMHNLQSKQSSAIEISGEGLGIRFSYFFTDGDIFAGVHNKETVIKRNKKAIETVPLNKYQRGFVTDQFSTYQAGYVLDIVRYSTFCYGRLKRPNTEIHPLVTIRGAHISLCCVNSGQLAGLLSENILYMYDIANCHIETIQLLPYMNQIGYYNKTNLNIVPSDKGVIVYSMKQVVIVSQFYGPDLARRYVVKTIDLEYDEAWRLIKYFYCGTDNSWFRLLRKTVADTLLFASVSHDHLVGKNWEELEWKPLPLTEKLEQISKGAHVFMIRLHKSLLKCHLVCPHCDALKAARTSQLKRNVYYYDSDDYFGASAYVDTSSDDENYHYGSD